MRTNSANSLRMVVTLIDLFFFQALFSVLNRQFFLSFSFLVDYIIFSFSFFVLSARSRNRGGHYDTLLNGTRNVSSTFPWLLHFSFFSSPAAQQWLRSCPHKFLFSFRQVCLTSADLCNPRSGDGCSSAQFFFKVQRPLGVALQ